MIKTSVRSKIVSKNIDQFKKIVHQGIEKGEQDSNNPSIYEYLGFVNLVTGSFRFSRFQFLNQTEWKKITIQINLHLKQVAIQEPGKDFFDFSSFDPIGLQLFKETLQVLQELVEKLYAIEELHHWEPDMALSRSSVEDVVFHAWHSVDRTQAEELLSTCSIGTFLFRKDPFALVLEQELKKNFKDPIKCVTLTYVDKDQRVRDHTLVNYKNAWLLYDNDPSLKGTKFPAITELLRGTGQYLKHPLRHSEEISRKPLMSS